MYTTGLQCNHIYQPCRKDNGGGDDQNNRKTPDWCFANEVTIGASNEFVPKVSHAGMKWQLEW
jgi:hypothetical protein